ncbi:glycosyltransferase family 2 protein [Algibacter lectus]|uniref:Glycosyltransferase involved in cell wall biosynthesis n=1 Tax=Algibacter lectus TaxID=221126 RepID=A0A4R8M382_9FLAO|nr:glycosyltransferase [Algibacter lectus]MWW26607.1 glycosyltransferase [Algibacter lectus]TDY59609.1 glycosyltransferase involved in cell wall biosynthesis [Algibacter lectus]
MLNLNSLVTVICSCYNHSDYIEKALNSVINQTYKNIQLIIIDDCSNDNSIEIIDKWILKNKTGLFIKNAKNFGLTKSVNSAFKNVEGTYFIDLAGDDVLLPHCIETQISIYNAYSQDKIGIVYGNAKVTDTINNTSYIYYDKFFQSKKTTSPTDGFIYKEILNHSNTICSVSALINTALFKKLGGYDENLAYEDYDLWLRVARKYSILYVDKVLVERIKLKTSLGNINFQRFNKKALQFKYSTYLIVKKTLKMNLTKEEDLASIQKINLEVKQNWKVLNILLIAKYYILLLKLKFRK